MTHDRSTARRRTAYGLAALCVLGASTGAAWVWQPETTAGPCEVVSGPASLPDVPETSGLAVGRRTRDVLWSHNDSGNDAVLFALDRAGVVRARVRVPVRLRDWEDVSAGRCPAGDCLYLADIGDNGVRRPEVTILRVPEPRDGDTATAPPEVFTATYADGPHNAEALFVAGQDVFVITKDRVGSLYRGNGLPAGGGALTLNRIGSLGLSTVTDAEASVDERMVVVRTPGDVVIYRTGALVAGDTAPALRIDVSGLDELQGEGVALDGSLLHLSSEGKPWSRAGSLRSLRCQLPTP